MSCYFNGIFTCFFIISLILVILGTEEKLTIFVILVSSWVRFFHYQLAVGCCWIHSFCPDDKHTLRKARTPSAEFLNSLGVNSEHMCSGKSPGDSPGFVGKSRSFDNRTKLRSWVKIGPKLWILDMRLIHS